jgi:hypothetical protein
MKTIKKKTYKVNEAIPETEKEEKEIKKIIKEVKEEDKNINPDEWESIKHKK